MNLVLEDDLIQIFVTNLLFSWIILLDVSMEVPQFTRKVIISTLFGYSFIKVSTAPRSCASEASKSTKNEKFI